jgi:hypothetical protein
VELIFEWDENKARENLRKHKVSFEEAKTIFNDPVLITFPDEYHSDDEERYVSIGLSAKRTVLLAVHTERVQNGDTLIIRLINCRKATARERRIYEEGEN